MNGPIALCCPPQPLLIKLFHFKNRNGILRVAHTLDKVTSNRNHISIFPAFSEATQKQRAAYTAVKRRLSDSNLP